MLRKIILENFMSHRRTEIELAEGLTVLTGPNNCGKSAIVAALQILATNGRTTHVMRHGEKLCRVTVETDDGHRIAWERKKKTVKYILNGEDVHRVGNSIPDSLHDLLRLDRVQADTGKATHDYDIHFGEQKSPVFLLDETGSRAASFFASSSDASRLVEMQHRHRSNVRERKAEAKRLTIEKKKNAERLKSYQPLDQITQLVAKAESAQQEIDSIQARITRLHDLAGSLARKIIARDRLILLQQTFALIERTAITPTLLQRDADRQERLSKVVSQVSSLTAQRRSLGKQNKTFEKLIAPSAQHDVDRVRTRISNLASLVQYQQTARSILASCIALTIPPSFHDTDSFRELLRRLTVSIDREVKSKRGKRTFSLLTRPPQITSVDRIRQTIAKLTQQQASVASAEIAKGALGLLHAPVDPSDLVPLESKIQQLRTLAQGVTKARKTSAAAQQKADQSEATIRAFVRSNPTCTICGGKIDPETLLSSMPGLHQHGLHQHTGGGATRDE